MSDREIARLRDEIAAVDEEIVALVARRLHLAEEIGLEKELSGLPVRDAGVEALVRSRLLEACRGRGVSEAFAASLSHLLVEESVGRQAGVRPPEPRPQRVAVVGGAGRMGRWLSRYLRARGHDVVVNDPAGAVEGFPLAPDLRRAVARADVVAVSVPLSAAASVLQEIADVGPHGLVFDLCSLKAPVAPALRSMASDGVRVASVHPLFGPDVGPASSGMILFSDCGSAAALREAKDLFQETGAALVDVPLDRHDRLMATVLGLSHLTLLAFARAADDPLAPPGLRHAAGTTFARLAAAADHLLGDSPEMLRDIQALNPHTPEVLRRLRDALDAWGRAAEDSDGKDFITMVEQARSFLGGPHA